MEAAIDRALDSGAMLEPEADELRVQLDTAVIPAYREPQLPGDVWEGAQHFFLSLVG